jgi:hypothetical protein
LTFQVVHLLFGATSNKPSIIPAKDFGFFLPDFLLPPMADPRVVHAMESDS